MIDEDYSIERMILASQSEPGEPGIYRYVVLSVEPLGPGGHFKYSSLRAGISPEQVVIATCGALYAVGLSNHRVEVYPGDPKVTSAPLATCETVHVHPAQEMNT